MKTMNKILAVAALGMAAVTAQAQTATTTFLVRADVLGACTVAATDLAFGNYLANAASPLDGTSTITVTCTSGLPYGVSLGASANARTMSRAGGFTLNYGMYNDAARSVAFGFTGASGNGVGQAYTVYGRVPAGQFVPVGTYTDTVTVTVAY